MTHVGWKIRVIVIMTRLRDGVKKKAVENLVSSTRLMLHN